MYKFLNTKLKSNPWSLDLWRHRLLGGYIRVAIHCFNHVHHWHYSAHFLQGRRPNFLVVAADGHVFYFF